MRKSSWLIAIMIVVDIFLLLTAMATASRIRFYFSHLSYFGRYGGAQSILHVWILTGVVILLFSGGMIYAAIGLRRRGE